MPVDAVDDVLPLMPVLVDVEVEPVELVSALAKPLVLPVALNEVVLLVEPDAAAPVELEPEAAVSLLAIELLALSLPVAAVLDVPVEDVLAATEPLVVSVELAAAPDEPVADWSAAAMLFVLEVAALACGLFWSFEA